MTKRFVWLAFLAGFAAVLYYSFAAMTFRRPQPRGTPSGKLIRHSGTELTEPTNFKASAPDDPVLAFDAVGKPGNQSYFFLSAKGDVVDTPPASAGNHVLPKNYLFIRTGTELYVAHVATPADQTQVRLLDPGTGQPHEVTNVPDINGHDLRPKAMGSKGWLILEAETVNDAGDKKKRLWQIDITDIENALVK